MAHADAFPGYATAAVIRQVGERLSSIAPPQALFPAPGAGPELGETFSVWMLGLNAVTQTDVSNTDIHQLATETGRWHHQVRYGGQAQAFARSMNDSRPGAGGWSVTQLFASHIAARIDEAIDWVDQNVPGDPLVRLVIIPAFHLHAFWLTEENGESQFLVIDMPNTFTKLNYKTLYSVREFLERLSQEPHAQGLPLQR